MAGLTLENISKTFSNSDKAAVKRLNLSIEQEDFLVLLGPSGCGGQHPYGPDGQGDGGRA